jgi:hypothetical protein
VDPLVAFDCRLLNSQQIGTHHVLIGAVEHVFLAGSGSPLIYANRAYGTPVRVDTHRLFEPAQAEALRVGAFHTFGPYLLPEALERLAKAGRLGEIRLLEGDQRRIMEALRSKEIEIALLYDFDLGEDVVVDRLGGVSPYVLLPEGHPLTELAAVPLADLAGEPLILLDAPPSGDYFLSIFEQQKLNPNIRLRLRSFEMVRGMVGHGLGYSLVATKPASNMTYDGRSLEPVLLVALEDVVAGRPRDAELAADIRHRLPIQDTGYEPQALVHDLILFPRHSTPPKGGKVSPMCPVRTVIYTKYMSYYILKCEYARPASCLIKPQQVIRREARNGRSAGNPPIPPGAVTSFLIEFRPRLVLNFDLFTTFDWFDETRTASMSSTADKVLSLGDCICERLAGVRPLPR